MKVEDILSGEIRIVADEDLSIRSISQFQSDAMPFTVDEADTALVNGLIDVREYCRCLISVEPLVDTLLDGDDQVRKGATFELKRRGGRNAVKLLEQALDDPSEEVRLFAAEALEKLDSVYNEAINGLIERIREKASRRLHFLLGRVYFDYAFKGMYDREMGTIYYEKAVVEFERCLKLSGEVKNWEIWQFLGAAYYELGDYQKSLHWYEKTRSQQGESANLLIRFAAVCFAQGKYDEVKKICKRIREEFGDADYGEVLRLWTT